MTQNPDALRADIEATRQRLGTNVDAVADKVTPSHIVQRRVDRVREAVFGARDDMEQSARTAAHRAQSAVSDVGEAVSDAPQTVVRKTQGNPLAAGLIAFGAGLLVSALIPPSEKERQAAEAVKEKAEPLTTKVQEAAQEVAEHLKEPAQEAMQNVRETATEAAQHVKSEGETAAADVQERATEARDRVQNQ